MSYYVEGSNFGRVERLGDVLIACTLLLISLPLIIVIALAIKWQSPGPILDGYTCIGSSGRRFRMLKFRTITYDPQRETPRWNETTSVGLLLWRTRIEALPQLVNVLRGE